MHASLLICQATHRRAHIIIYSCQAAQTGHNETETDLNQQRLQEKIVKHVAAYREWLLELEPERCDLLTRPSISQPHGNSFCATNT